MSTFLGFGNGADATKTVTGSEVYSQIVATASAITGSKLISATGSFSAGQIIAIHQTRGGDATAGLWEIHQVASYTSGSITTKWSLGATYISDSDNTDLAQVMVVPQFKHLNISGTLTAGAWAGGPLASHIGGLFPVMVNGTTTITGTLSVSSLGYEGGQIPASDTEGNPGEGSTQTNLTSSILRNTNGGGGGKTAGTSQSGGSGGANGAVGVSGSTSSEPGSVVGNEALTQLVFGGGGGGAGSGFNAFGGRGGGGLILITKNLDCSGGYILANGGNGTNNTGNGGGGGGGGGGSILIKAQNAIIGNDRITATPGAGGTAGSGFTNGGNGGNGRIRLECCSLTGVTTSGEVSVVKGGHTFCGSLAYMI